VVSVSAKFVFATHPAKGGAEFAAALREYAVLVRHFNKPCAAAYLRITIGTVDDTKGGSGGRRDSGGRGEMWPARRRLAYRAFW
jgi:hypothetical protein